MNVKARFKRYCYLIADLFPSHLPIGLTAFDAWADRLKFTYFPPGAIPPDHATYRFSLAAMIMHLGSHEAKVRNRFFGKAIYKGAANQVANYVMHEEKARRDAKIKAEEDAARLRAELANTSTQTQAEATADSVADGPTQ